MGQSTAGMYLVETPEDVLSLQVSDASQLSYVTQTTLSVDDAAKVIDALRVRFPLVQGPKKDDICYATQNRQDAVKALAAKCDLVIVVGSPNSSNSRRLREVAAGMNVEAYLIDGAAEISSDWLVGKRSIGVSAGASAPEVLVKEVIDRLQALTQSQVHQMPGVEEGVSFPLPKELSGFSQ